MITIAFAGIVLVLAGLLYVSRTYPIDDASPGVVMFLAGAVLLVGAFKGTFSDLKLIKTRSVAQVVIEIPIEEADKALSPPGGP